jgi:Periplasmic binding protein
MHSRVFNDAKKTATKIALVALFATALAIPVQAQKKYDPGATDTEIKIGNIMPYSGPASAYATIGKTEKAYFDKLNSEGGINGRKINFVSYDDGYSPPKAVEQARKLVESDKGANVDIFMNIATPKFAAQAIKKIGELDWHPVQFLTNVSVSIGSVMKPAGYENDQGILTTAYLKDPKDPEWKDDPAMTEWRAFMSKWYPEGDQDDVNTVFAYGVAKGLEQVLRQCGDDLTRENVMKQAANLNLEIGIYLPGTKIKTSPTDFAPIEQLQMERFKGEAWERFGPLMSGEKSS